MNVDYRMLKSENLIFDLGTLICSSVQAGGAARIDFLGSLFAFRWMNWCIDIYDVYFFSTHKKQACPPSVFTEVGN